MTADLSPNQRRAVALFIAFTREDNKVLLRDLIAEALDEAELRGACEAIQEYVE